MRKLFSIILFAFLTTSVLSQVHSQELISQVKKMTESYNKRDLKTYVDFLLPVYYQSDTSNIANYIKLWDMILDGDTRHLEFVKLLDLHKYDNQDQALFQFLFDNKKTFIIGISDINSNKWHFTQVIPQDIKFNIILNNIPTLDHSFAKLIDLQYEKRIDFKINEPISSFNLTDINGMILSSDSLKDKAIVLNFWSTTCAPCIKEIPELNKLVEKYHNSNIQFIAPAFDKSKDDIKNRFLIKNPFFYNIVLVNESDYTISSLPTHIIINRKHEVVDIIIGYSIDNIRRLDKCINEILK